MARSFASQGDMADKRITFAEVGDGLWAFTAEGDPTRRANIGDEA